jgi:hypothetical protein
MAVYGKPGKRWCVFSALPTNLGNRFSNHRALAQTTPEQSATAAAGAESPQWQQELAEWRAQREKEISAPDGWLTLAGLDWLKTGFNSVGAGANNQIRLPGLAPERLGLLTVNGKTPAEDPSNAAPSTSVVQLLAPPGGFPPDLTLDGKPAREGSLIVDNAKPSTIAWHGLSLVVLKRGDRLCFASRMRIRRRERFSRAQLVRAGPELPGYGAVGSLQAAAGGGRLPP